MHAKDFFKYKITDNSYQGFSINEINLDRDFYCNTYKKQRKNHINIRKSGIENFLFELRNKFTTATINELKLNTFLFDEEFEANTDQKIFEVKGHNFDNLTIHTGNIVGSLLYNSHSFNINCRFGNDFLQYMIASTSGFIELENMGSINQSLGLGEWIIIYYWKLQLKKAFSLGIYKTYEGNRSNTSVIKGNIDINSLITKQYFDGKTMCNYREHSYKNDLNAVINMAITKVFKSKYLPVVSDIYNIKNAFSSINTKPIRISELKQRRVLNSYFQQYNLVYDLSLKILNDEFANVGAQKNTFSVFLFDISLLFEHHIRKLLKTKFTLFPKNKEEFSIPNGIFYNRIYPDVIIDFGGNEIGVYDVKYKNFDFKNGVQREDRFQLTSYVATHLSKYKIIECGLIYPLRENEYQKTNTLTEQYLKIADYDIPFKVKFYKIGNNINNQKNIDIEFLNFGKAEYGKEVLSLNS